MKEKEKQEHKKTLINIKLKIIKNVKGGLEVKNIIKEAKFRQVKLKMSKKQCSKIKNHTKEKENG